MSNQNNRVFLQVSAGLVGLAAIVQAVLGGIAAFGNDSLVGVHGIIGMATFVLTIVATVAAWLAVKGADNKGLLFHAGGTALIALVQVALGEMGMETLHITVGVAFLVAAVALATLSFRKPAAA